MIFANQVWLDNCSQCWFWLIRLFWPITFVVTIVSIGNNCNVKPDWPEYPDQPKKILYTIGCWKVLVSRITYLYRFHSIYNIAIAQLCPKPKISKYSCRSSPLIAFTICKLLHHWQAQKTSYFICACVIVTHKTAKSKHWKGCMHSGLIFKVSQPSVTCNSCSYCAFQKPVQTHFRRYFLLLARSNSNSPRSFQRFRRTLRPNFIWIRQQVKFFPIDPHCKSPSIF